MKLKPGCAEEYKRRHREIWPELVKKHSEYGIRDYSIFFDEKSLVLFAFRRIAEGTHPEKMREDELFRPRQRRQLRPHSPRHGHRDRGARFQKLLFFARDHHLEKSAKGLRRSLCPLFEPRVHRLRVRVPDRHAGRKQLCLLHRSDHRQTARKTGSARDRRRGQRDRRGQKPLLRLRQPDRFQRRKSNV